MMEGSNAGRAFVGNSPRELLALGSLFFCLALGGLFFAASPVRADGTPVAEDSSGNGAASDERTSNPASANYYKDHDLLPGEEVVTPTGQRLKVWSTEGPVPVAQPPEPFADPSRTQLPANTNIVIDPSRYRNGGRAPASGAPRAPVPQRPPGADTFVATPQNQR